MLKEAVFRRLGMSLALFAVVGAVCLHAAAVEGASPGRAHAANDAVHAPSAVPLYKQAGAPIPERVHDLLSRMTVEEKVMQLQHPWGSMTPQQIFAKYNATGLGTLYLFWCGGSTPSEIVAARNAVQKMFVEQTRLGIPVSFVQEALHGAGTDDTIFPMPINLGASFNLSLVEQIHRRIAVRARAAGADRVFNPVINLFTDPRFGRQQEGYSEDPIHTAMMATAAVSGLQGGSGGPDTYLADFNTSVIATVKHYAGYGMTAGGIDGSPADLSEAKLRLLYLLPWKVLAEKQLLRSVMAAQNMVNGRPMHANKRLLTTVLRQEWGVTNALVESDGGDCIGALQSFRVAATRQAAAVLAVKAGMDMDLGGVTLPTLVNASKEIDMADIDRAAGNVLTSKFAAGLFEQPYTDPSALEPLDSDADRALAREAAQQGIVLLRNNNSFLPIDLFKYTSIAVIGTNANSTAAAEGGYAHDGAHVVTVLEALQTLHSDVRYAQGEDPNSSSQSMIAAAVAAAEAADLVVAVLGDSQTTCGEMYDRASLDMPGAQLPLLQALAATKKPIVLVMVHGRSVTFGPDNAVLGSLQAVLAAWRPGEEGGNAVVDILTGAVNPSAKTTSAWPRAAGQIGGPGQPYLYPFQGDHMHENYVFADSSALFPFGFGLSYSQWTLTNLAVAPVQARVNDTLTITLNVVNHGPHDGAQVAQIYIEQKISSIVRIASKQLFHFAKVQVPSGGSEQVTLSLPVAELAMYDDETSKYVVEPGEFVFYAGYNGPDGIEQGGLKQSIFVV